MSNRLFGRDREDGLHPAPIPREIFACHDDGRIYMTFQNGGADGGIVPWIAYSDDGGENWSCVNNTPSIPWGWHVAASSDGITRKVYLGAAGSLYFLTANDLSSWT